MSVITMTHQPIIKLCKYLYNAGYSDFCISDECREKYTELFNEPLAENIEGERMNQNLIKVIELLGFDKCKGTRKSTRLAIDLLPAELTDYIQIHDYDGQESVYISYDEAYSNLLAQVMKEGVISDENKIKYERINYIRLMCCKHEFSNEEIFATFCQRSK